MTSRENSTGLGTHEYTEGRFTITLMGDDRWYIFIGKSDVGEDFKTLAAARKWCKRQAAAESPHEADFS